MWLITNFGFFSVVEKADDRGAATLTVRARVRADLDALRERYLPAMGPISADAGTDYKYRAKVPRAALAEAAAQIVRDIDYGNFKSSVASRQGHKRAGVYHDVWDVLFTLPDQEASPAALKPAAPASTSGLRSYGGVLIDDQGRVLLREPAGHFDGYVWTFPKGKGDESRDSQVEIALREVLEETGYRAEIVQRLPREFRGGTGVTVFFLMRPVGEPVPFDPLETQMIRWATPDEARSLIGRTTNRVGRERDLDVLDEAVRLHQSLSASRGRGTDVNRAPG